MASGLTTGSSAESDRLFKPGENLKCLSHIVKTEGVTGLYRGLTASYLGGCAALCCECLHANERMSFA